MDDAKVAKRVDVVNQMLIDESSALPDDITRPITYCDAICKAINKKVKDKKHDVDAKRQRIQAKSNDVGQEDDGTDMEVSQFSSVLRGNDKVQIVKPLAVQALRKIPSNVEQLTKNIETIIDATMEVTPRRSGRDRSIEKAQRQLQCSRDVRAMKQLVRITSMDWAAGATKKELRDFVEQEVQYDMPYEGRSYVVDRILIRRGLDNAWRGQSIKRFDQAVVERHFIEEDKDYLEEVLTCPCGVDAEAKRAAYRLVIPHWQIENGSADDLIHRLNVHEHHLLVEAGYSAEIQGAASEENTPVSVGSSLSPVDETPTEVGKNQSKPGEIPPLEDATDVPELVSADAARLAEGATENCARAIKSWLAQMDVIEQEFGGKCTESTEIMQRLEAYRLQRLAEINQREEDALSDGSTDDEYYAPEPHTYQRIEVLQPPRWHGGTSWRAFWGSFCHWCQHDKVHEKHRAYFLRQAISGPVENKLTEILGSGAWTYEQTLGALQDRCRRLVIGRKHASAVDFVRGSLHDDDVPVVGRAAWQQYSETLFKWCDEMHMGSAERSFFFWRQIATPAGAENRAMTKRVVQTNVKTFEDAYCLQRHAADNFVSYYGEHLRAKANEMPLYDGATTVWSTFHDDFKRWCDDRKCGAVARTQWLRRALRGNTREDVVHVVGVDAIEYERLVGRIERSSVGTKTRKSYAGTKQSQMGMPHFFGNEWRHFIRSFENACDRHSLSDDDEARAHYLRRALVGAVARDVGTITGVDLWTYPRLRFELEFRYSGEPYEPAAQATQPFKLRLTGFNKDLHDRRQQQAAEKEKPADTGARPPVSGARERTSTVPNKPVWQRFLSGDAARPSPHRIRRSGKEELSACQRTRRYVNWKLTGVTGQLSEVQRRNEALEKKMQEVQRSRKICSCQENGVRWLPKKMIQGKGYTKLRQYPVQEASVESTTL